MIGDTPLCLCSVCTETEPEYYVSPQYMLDSVRCRTARTVGSRIYCPRCRERLGCAEIVVDSVGYAHITQHCCSCDALWVL